MTALLESSRTFLAYLETWLAALPELPLPQAAPDPDRAAIVSVDVTDGFCTSGPLASERVGRIVEPIAALMRSAWDHGIRSFLLPQDAHEPDALEFASWPPHCVRGTPEAETVAPIKALPFFDQMLIMPKDSIHSGMNTGLNEWIAAHPEVDTWIVVGDCTDLCTYQLAMHLRLHANAHHMPRRVIVPMNCVDTYDRPVEAALQQGGFPHPAELIHAVSLYHMALNGIEVVRCIS